MEESSIQKYLQKEIKKNSQSVYEQIADSESQIERLLSKKWNNPYEVLLAKMTDSFETITKNYKRFLKSLHPDRCSFPKAKEAFSVIQKAYQTLQNPDSQKIYKRILKEAFDKTVFEREQNNKIKKEKNLPLLPNDTFDVDLQINCRRLFSEIEEKKKQLFKYDEDQRLKRNEKLQELALKEHYKILTEEEWDKTRQKRIAKWKVFKNRNNKIGSKNSDFSMRSFRKNNN